MKVNCLSCGHSLDLRDAYDDYEGQVRCFICASLLAIRTEDGRVKSVVVVQGPSRGGCLRVAATRVVSLSRSNGFEQEEATWQVRQPPVEQVCISTESRSRTPCCCP